MKLVRLSIIALSLGIFVASCSVGTSSETRKHESTAVPAQSVRPRFDTNVIPITAAAQARYNADSAEQAARDADSFAYAAHAAADYFEKAARVYK